MANPSQENTYINERLELLLAIDDRIVNLLGQISVLFDCYSKNDRTKIEPATEEIYSTLGNIAIDLRKEVKAMDDNIGVYDNRDQVMILPIPVDQKNTLLGRTKLEVELKEMDVVEPMLGIPERKKVEKKEVKPEEVSDVVEVKEEAKEEVKMEGDEGLEVIEVNNGDNFLESVDDVMVID